MEMSHECRPYDMVLLWGFLILGIGDERSKICTNPTSVKKYLNYAN